VDDRKAVGVVYLDFTKAFPRSILVEKPAAHGLDGCTLRCIKNRPNGRAQRVVVNGVKSSWQPVMSGVPQGSVLDVAFLTSLSMIWMRGLSAPSVSLQKTPSWVGVLICFESRKALQRDLDRLA